MSDLGLAYKPLEQKSTNQKVKTLAELDLNKELLDQYIAAKDLGERANTDDGIPLNQKAQVINSITAIITQIVKLQEDLYNMEQLKKLETALIDTLQRFPELKEDFLKAYRKEVSK